MLITLRAVQPLVFVYMALSASYRWIGLSDGVCDESSWYDDGGHVVVVG